MISCSKNLLLPLLGLFCLQQLNADDGGRLSEGAGHNPSIDSSIRENQLILPKSYQQHRPLLWKAAALTIQTSRCTRFLSGDLQRDYSTLTHPIFRIQCRDRENQSYALLVDGLSMRVLDNTHPDGSISFADIEQEFESGSEYHRIPDVGAAAEALVADHNETLLPRQPDNRDGIEDMRPKLLWEQCLQQLERRVRNMNNLVWLTQGMPEPEVGEDNRLIYYIDFDAQDLYRQQLHYRAECSITDSDNLKLQIRPKKNLQADISAG